MVNQTGDPSSDPNALLLYNDNDLEYGIPDQESKRTAVLKLLRLKSCPWVHGLGIQAHLNLVMGEFNPSKPKAFLHHVAQLGLKIIVTEMDVTDKDLPTDNNVRDSIIAKNV